MQPWAQRLHAIISTDPTKSMEGLVKAVGISQPSAWQWFNAPAGKLTTQMITANNAVRAAHYAGVTVEYLITGRVNGDTRNEPTPDTGLNLETLKEAIAQVDAACDAANANATPELKSTIIAALYKGLTHKEDETQTAATLAMAAVINSLKTGATK